MLWRGSARATLRQRTLARSSGSGCASSDAAGAWKGAGGRASAPLLAAALAGELPRQAKRREAGGESEAGGERARREDGSAHGAAGSAASAPSPRPVLLCGAGAGGSSSYSMPACAAPRGTWLGLGLGLGLGFG